MSDTYENNRVTTHPTSLDLNEYDYDGRETRNRGRFVANVTTSTYNAAGQLETYLIEGPGNPKRELKRFCDGNELEGKRTERNFEETEPDEWEWSALESTYYVRSSVLGGEVITELGPQQTYIQANGTVVAKTPAGGSTTVINYQHKDPNINTIRETEANGALYGNSTRDLSPDGQSLGTADPYTSGIPAFVPEVYDPDQDFSSMENGVFTVYMVDGIRVTRGHLRSAYEQIFGDFRLIEHKSRVTYIKPDIWVPAGDGELDADGNIRIGTVHGGRAFNMFGWSPSILTNFRMADERFYAQMRKIRKANIPCDNRMARIFGDDDAMVASTHLRPPR